eukprot:363634-Chlamydomonas_euryale.AAC.26
MGRVQPTGGTRSYRWRKTARISMCAHSGPVLGSASAVGGAGFSGQVLLVPCASLLHLAFSDNTPTRPPPQSSTATLGRVVPSQGGPIEAPPP